MTTALPWCWGPALHRAYADWGLEYVVVPKNSLWAGTGLDEWEIDLAAGIVDPEEAPPTDAHFLGSSLGDATYDGEKVYLEAGCYKPWVAHELAHFIVCAVDTPELLGNRNYGFELPGFDLDSVVETAASALTCGLLTRLGLPWREAAMELALAESHSKDIGPETYYNWSACREDLLNRSSVYLAQWPNGGVS